MNILIVTQYFWPENFLINDLSVDLAERGHNVTVLTGSPNYPKGNFFDGYGVFNRPQVFHGVKVLRVPIIPRGKGGGLRLALNYASFALTGSILGPFLCKDKYDLIFVFEPSPFTVGIPAVILKSLKSAPVFFWVQDLWPESLSAAGAVKSGILLALIEKMVRSIYRRCDRILIQSRSFFDSIVRLGGNPDKILYFPNSAENIFHSPLPMPGTLPPLPEGFRIMFAGNIGAAQDFGTIISAAEILCDFPDIQWIIVGDGRMRQWAEQEVKKRRLEGCFHFLGRHPLETMPSFFASADALLVSLKKESIFALTIPSKVQSYLACGRPVIAALDGEGARIIDDAGAGFSCPAETPEALAGIVIKMYRTPQSERELMGTSGRRYYQENFDRKLLLGRLEQWMQNLSAD